MKYGTKPGTEPGTPARRLLQPDICERWRWRDPQEIVERLLAESVRIDRTDGTVRISVPAVPVDRYYTQAKRLHVKQLMRGRK